jgi:ribosome biogenesis GTPase
VQEGVVIKAYGGFYYVRVGKQLLECRLRGKFRLQKLNALPGDIVQIAETGLGKGVVEAILPRKNELVRPLIANVEQVLLVFAGHDPEPDLALLDRLLILTEIQGLKPLVCFNKCDLLTPEELDVLMTVYKQTGYQVEIISARAAIGLDNIRLALQHRISVIAGPSGAGKSTLLNSIEPGLSLKTGEVSARIGRGRHTTRHVELLPLSFGGLVADTPGFSSLFLPEMRREDLAGYFPEFSAYLGQCRFNGCLHDREPDCVVKEALEQGNIARERYTNYLAFLAEVKEKERRY